jgi:hypothetical protein
LKSQFDLHAAVLIDQLRLLGYDATRDLATLRSRVESEGEEFLTLTLPTLGQFLERGLEDGQLIHNGPFAFANKSKTDHRPAFMHAAWAEVFDSEGILLPYPRIDAVRAIRQVSYLHGKLKELPTQPRVEAALAGYIATDEAIAKVTVPKALQEEFRRTALRLWGTHFDHMERYVYENEFLGVSKHGPGAVAQKLTSNGKWQNREWTERLDVWFRSTLHLAHSLSCEGDDLVLHPPGDEPPARVISVPKTAKGPRIITAEPVYNQFIQQGLAALFERWMFKHPSVSYEFQEPNQLLACEGSWPDGKYATIDLSEASDRVSLRIVKDLFYQHPNLLSAILSCRSQRSVLPDGTTVLLRKFASMGSALTFPIETLVFATIASMAVAHTESRQVKHSEVLDLRVYGDDIIVPVTAANECVQLLEAFGLKVNVHKSFMKGNFRESCGGDYFLGSPVSPVRVRKRLPHNRSFADEVVSIVAFRNLYWEQYGPTEFVTLLDAFISGIIPFPVGPKWVDALVRWDYITSPEGYDVNFHRPYVMAVRPVYTYRNDPLDGVSALLKFFWTPFNEDPKHLQRAGRPISARLKYGRVLV